MYNKSISMGSLQWRMNVSYICIYYWKQLVVKEGPFPPKEVHKMSGTQPQYTSHNGQRSARDAVLAAVKQDSSALIHASEEMRADGDIVLAAVKQSGWTLKFASYELRSNLDLVLVAVKQDGRSLEYASDELRSNLDIVRAAVKQNGRALEYATGRLRSERDVVLTAVKQEGSALEYASDEMRSDRDVVLAAVNQYGMTLEYATGGLRSDRGVVLAAVKQNGRALKYASYELRSDRDVVLAAVKQEGSALKFATDELRSDRDVVLAAVKQDGWFLEYATGGLRSDRDVVLTAVKQNGRALIHASIELRSDRDLVLAAVTSRGRALQLADSTLQRDRGIVIAAALQDKCALEYADDCLRFDESLLREVDERAAAARYSANDTRFTLDPSWDAATAARFVSERFAASGKLACGHGPSALVSLLRPLVGYRISSIELLSNATCAAATSALSRVWESAPRHSACTVTDELLVVQGVFDGLLRESGGNSMIVYHGCSASAARSIAEHGFINSSVLDNGYFGRGIYVTPNAEYACMYATDATVDGVGAVVMCRACVPFAYCVTRADYDDWDATAHSVLFGKALKSEEAHFALVSRSTNYEACTLDRAEYSELCVSQVAALCPIAILLVEATDGATTHSAPSILAVQHPPVSASSAEQPNSSQQHQHPLGIATEEADLDSEGKLQRDHGRLAAAKQNAGVLKYASAELRSDRNVVIAAVKQDNKALKYASDELQSDHELVLAAVNQDGRALEYAASELQSERDVVLAAVKQHGSALEYASDELRSDYDIVLAAVQQDGIALEYATGGARLDHDVNLAAVKQNCWALKYASDELRSDHDLVLAAVKQDGGVLEYASKELQSDHDVVIAAVKQNCWALEHASDKLRSDRDIVLTAVKQYGMTLEHAASELRSDRDVVLTAMKQNGRALEYASYELQSDHDIVLAAVKNFGWALAYASDEMRSNRDVVLTAVKQHGTALEYASDELRSDHDVVLAAVEQNYLALTFASDEMRSDREIVLAAVKQNGRALEYASDEMRSDHDIVLAAVNQDGSALKYASDELQSDHGVALAAVKQDGWALEFASDELRSDRDVVFAAVGSRGRALQLADSTLRRDRGIVIAAALQDKCALKYADDCLRFDERLLREVDERAAAARYSATDTRFILDPSWDAATAARFVSERFAASGKLACGHGPSAPASLLRPLVGYRISSIELLSNATCAAATSALSRVWESAPRHSACTVTDELLVVQGVFDGLLRESGGGSMIVYHGCSASAARSIAEHGFINSSVLDNGYFGRGIYVTPNAEYACMYATAATVDGVGAVVMCRACVPFAYCVTRADYDDWDATAHSLLFGKALKSEEAHFALVSRSTNYESCAPERAEYSELCVSQVAALCPIAILHVETTDGATMHPEPSILAAQHPPVSASSAEQPNSSQHPLGIASRTADLDSEGKLQRDHDAAKQNAASLQDASDPQTNLKHAHS